jgi:hypothetical protein
MDGGVKLGGVEGLRNGIPIQKPEKRKFVFTYLFGCREHNRRNNAQSPVIESYIPPRPGLHRKKPHVTG